MYGQRSGINENTRLFRFALSFSPLFRLSSPSVYLRVFTFTEHRERLASSSSSSSFSGEGVIANGGGLHSSIYAHSSSIFSHSRSLLVTPTHVPELCAGAGFEATYFSGGFIRLPVNPTNHRSHRQLLLSVPNIFRVDR